jgi:hypothetical protein
MLAATFEFVPIFDELSKRDHSPPFTITFFFYRTLTVICQIRRLIKLYLVVTVSSNNTNKTERTAGQWSS